MLKGQLRPIATMTSLHDLRQDILYALRALRTNPIFALTAVLTLALGIGANTAVFTLIRTVLLKPLEYSNPDQLVQISGGATPTRFDETKSEARCFQGIAAFSGQESLTLAAANHEPEVLTGVRVSANFLSILEVKPILGNSFLPADDSPGGRPVVLISAELWNRRFNADSKIIGTVITLEAAPYTIIRRPPAAISVPPHGGRRLAHPSSRMAAHASQIACPQPLPYVVRPLASELLLCHRPAPRLR